MARHFLDPKFQHGRSACAVCGKPVIDANCKRVYLGEGCFDAITDDEPDFDGLTAPVGSDCAKSIPEQFFVK